METVPSHANSQERAQRAEQIFDLLDPLYTREKTALRYQTPLQLLIATILSAQSTDNQVNQVTPALFKKYQTAQDYASAPTEELEALIHPTGFYRNKAKAIRQCCQALVGLYQGEVPGSMDQLLRLPGVGRKTANCVLGAAFDIPGVVVDTHVKRLCLRLGLTTNKNPDKIEADIQRLLPKDRWRRFSDVLIYHGRSVCKARRPDHQGCVLYALCPSRSL